MTRPRRITIPGPGHSSRDQSLSVTFDPTAPDGFVCTSFAGDDWRACKDYIRATFGLPRTLSACPAPLGTRTSGQADNASRTAPALSLWNDAREQAGTPVERYLARRGVKSVGAAVRYHPACPFAGQ